MRPELEHEERERAEDNSRSRKKWILIAAFAACAIVTIVVLALVINSNVSKNKQRAIELVKECLDESGSTYDSRAFEAWRVTGDKNMMEVSATYYPQGSEDVPHEMKWQVNLGTGRVFYLETVDPDG